jgi:hypothetical protein
MREFETSSEMGTRVRVGEESSDEGLVNVWHGGRVKGSGVRGQIRVLLSSEREIFGNEEARPA